MLFSELSPLSCLLLSLKIKISQIKSLLPTLASGDDDHQSFGTVVVVMVVLVMVEVVMVVVVVMVTLEGVL